MAESPLDSALCVLATDDLDVRYTAVSSFIFLRFFAPAILSPNLFQLTPHHTVSEHQARSASPPELASPPKPASPLNQLVLLNQPVHLNQPVLLKQPVLRGLGSESGSGVWISQTSRAGWVWMNFLEGSVCMFVVDLRRWLCCGSPR